jgi:hypothetical protein
MGFIIKADSRADRVTSTSEELAAQRRNEFRLIHIGGFRFANPPAR